MFSYYETKNIILAEFYTKSRKLRELNQLFETESVSSLNYDKIKKEILEEETESQVESKFDEEDREHWIHYYANKTASDLLTLGKVQPETMLAMSLLPSEDFEEIVKHATIKANSINAKTMDVEKRINLNSIPSQLT
jgi:hypothetical protein